MSHETKEKYQNKGNLQVEIQTKYRRRTIRAGGGLL